MTLNRKERDRLDSLLALDAAQVGKLIGVHPTTIRRWWRDRTLPHLPTKPGQRRRMSRVQLDDWLIAKRRPVGASVDER